MNSASSSKTSHIVRDTRSPESFASAARRDMAAEILQSYEKLSWYSSNRCESIQQTRLHFQNMTAGFTAEDEAALVDWPTDNSPIRIRNTDGPSPRPGDKEIRGKERTSGGYGAMSNPASPNSGSRAYGDATSKKKRKSTGRS